MINFLLKIISSVLKSLIVFVILFIIAVSLYSGKFPPNLKLVKDSVDQLAQAKEKYLALTRKSENYLQQMSAEEKLNAANETRNTNTVESGGRSNKIETDNIQSQLKIIKSQMDRIEEQNKLILRSLSKSIRD